MTFGPYSATVVAMHDGDTMTLLIDLGFDITFKCNCRVFGINAPELKKKASDPDGPGEAALAYAQSILPVGSKVTVVSHSWDKFGGRFDGSVAFNGVNFAQAMLDSGNAVVLKV